MCLPQATDVQVLDLFGMLKLVCSMALVRGYALGLWPINRAYDLSSPGSPKHSQELEENQTRLTTQATNQIMQLPSQPAQKATPNPRSLTLKRFAASGMASSARAARAGCQFCAIHGHDVLPESVCIHLLTDRFSCLSGTATYRILPFSPSA